MHARGQNWTEIRRDGVPTRNITSDAISIEDQPAPRTSVRPTWRSRGSRALPAVKDSGKWALDRVQGLADAPGEHVGRFPRNRDPSSGGRRTRILGHSSTPFRSELQRTISRNESSSKAPPLRHRLRYEVTEQVPRCPGVEREARPRGLDPHVVFVRADEETAGRAVAIGTVPPSRSRIAFPSAMNRPGSRNAGAPGTGPSNTTMLATHGLARGRVEVSTCPNVRRSANVRAAVGGIVDVRPSRVACGGPPSNRLQEVCHPCPTTTKTRIPDVAPGRSYFGAVPPTSTSGQHIPSTSPAGPDAHRRPHAPVHAASCGDGSAGSQFGPERSSKALWLWGRPNAPVTRAISDSPSHVRCPPDEVRLPVISFGTCAAQPHRSPRARTRSRADEPTRGVAFVGGRRPGIPIARRGSRAPPRSRAQAEPGLLAGRSRVCPRQLSGQPNRGRCDRSQERDGAMPLEPGKPGPVGSVAGSASGQLDALDPCFPAVLRAHSSGCVFAVGNVGRASRKRIVVGCSAIRQRRRLAQLPVRTTATSRPQMASRRRCGRARAHASTRAPAAAASSRRIFGARSGPRGSAYRLAAPAASSPCLRALALPAGHDRTRIGHL
jgi:hypothetical protein